MSNIGRNIVDSLGKTFHEIKQLATGEKSIHDTLEDVFDAPRGTDVIACPTPNCVRGAQGHEGECSPVALVKGGNAPSR